MTLARYRPIALAVIAAAVLAACGPNARSVSSSTITSNISGLQLDRSEAPSVVYKRPGAPTLANYNRFIVDTVQVNYSDPDMRELDPADVQRIQRYLQGRTVAELRRGGYTVGTRSSPGTMRVSFVISGLEAPSALANLSLAIAPIALSVGSVTVEGVFREATTNRIDAVVLARSQGSRVLNTKPWSTWADVESGLDQWAEGLRLAVDKAHGR